MKYDDRIELKTLRQKETLLIMSNVSFCRKCFQKSSAEEGATMWERDERPECALGINIKPCLNVLTIELMVDMSKYVQTEKI